MEKKITPAQCRAARAFVDIHRKDLAEATGVSINTIGKFEGEKTTPIPANMERIVTAFNGMGIRFTEGGGLEPVNQQAEDAE